MIAGVEKTETLEREDSSGKYFTVQISSPDRKLPSNLDEVSLISLNQDFQILKDILRVSPQEVREAMNSALMGRASRIRFRICGNDSISSYELHCFPHYGSVVPGIGCFLIDRTRDEVDLVEKDSRIYELDLIGQAVMAFAETRNLSEILRIILLAVTAGKGLGFNRGFILLSDDARESLWGCMGTGPSSPEEAGKIWKDLSQKSMAFDEILRLYKDGGSEDAPINKLILSVQVPLSGDPDFIARAALEKRPIICGPDMILNDNDRRLRDIFGVDYMAVVPLITRDSLQGVILADNIITRRPILQSDLSLLQIFARYASDAIENSRLYGKLEHQVTLLKEANETIIGSRENLVRAEKLSSIGRMAQEVAHEIRNPLTIIGGYANMWLKKISQDDPSRKVLDLVSSQVSRIEKTLDRFSSVVRLSEKKEDKFPVVELVKETLRMLANYSDSNLPELRFDEDESELLVYLDKGLFHQALMVILREAARIAHGMKNLGLVIVRDEESAMIFIDGSENNPNFAENFYGGMRKGKEEERYQNMAVALEILRHYGGDIGVGTSQGIYGRLFIQIPLWREKT